MGTTVGLDAPWLPLAGHGLHSWEGLAAEVMGGAAEIPPIDELQRHPRQLPPHRGCSLCQRALQDPRWWIHVEHTCIHQGADSAPLRAHAASGLDANGRLQYDRS